MRLIRLLLLSSAVLLFNFYLLAKEKPTKYALIIAVGNYPKNTGWNPISSTNDTTIIKDALLKQGFVEKNIKVIFDDGATKQNIVRQLKLLTERVTEGDVVVVHFSGHGQQILDDNGDEPDGYDESIIPFDAHIRFTNKYKGENHLRDDELKELLNGLRYKLGKNGNVLVILDSCHSGTGTRGYQKHRGTQIKFQPPGVTIEGQERESGFIDIGQNSDFSSFELSPLITFSGSSPEQLNFEYTDKDTDITYGSLSYAFCKVFSKIDNTTTYRGLFDKILVEMSSIAPKQTPQAEGEIDKLIFNGQTVRPKSYFKVKKKVDENTFILNGGNLMELYEGTEVGFYDIDTYDYSTTEPKITGKIISSTALTSKVLISGNFPEGELFGSWVYVTKQTFGNNKVRIKIGKFKKNKKKVFLESIFETNKQVLLTNEAPDLIIESNNDSLYIFTKDDMQLTAFSTLNKNETQIEQLLNDEINRFFQSNFLRNLQLNASDFEVTFDIRPIALKWQGSGYVEDVELPLSDKINSSNQVEFKEGDAFKFVIKSKGYTKAFYQIIDIQPDNQINILVPSGKNTPSEYIIYPGEADTLDEIFVIGKPYGKEVFKLIATEEPLDLSSIVKTRGQDDIQSVSPFEQLFRATYNQSRGAQLAVPPETVSTYSIVFQIVK